MRKDFSTTAIVLIVFIVVAVAIYFVIFPNLPQSSTTVRLGDGVFRAKLATNDADRQKGLSGVTNMSADQALLMVYPESSKWGIWMKDMKVSLDIVWLDEDKKVVYIVKNAEPADDASLKTFVPKSVAKYVLELPAGTVDAKAIKTDSTASFQISEERVE